jgi:hypothetical protein
MLTLDLVAYYAKAVAGLVSAVATSLLAVYGADTEVGKLLTVIVAIAGAVAVYAIPNRQPAGVPFDSPEDLEHEDHLDEFEPVDLDSEPGQHRAEG